MCFENLTLRQYIKASGTEAHNTLTSQRIYADVWEKCHWDSIVTA